MVTPKFLPSGPAFGHFFTSEKKIEKKKKKKEKEV